MSETAVLKSISIVGFWLIVVIICPLPLYSRFFNPDPNQLGSTRAAAARARLADKICSLSNSLSGGLFLALAIIHLLPEAAESFGEMYDEETVDKYRPAFAVAFCSYTLLLVIQRVVFSSHGHSHGHDGHLHEDEEEDHPTKSLAAPPIKPIYGSSVGAQDTGASLLAHADDERTATTSCRSSRRSTLNNTRRPHAGPEQERTEAARAAIRESTRRSDVLVRIVLDHEGDEEEAVSAPEPTAALYHDAADASAHVDTSAHHEHHHHSNTKVITSIVLVLAFSMHGLAEGMALGVQEGTDNVGLMILAIAMHKWAEALSIGVSFQKSKLPRRQCLVYILAFSLSSPLGIGLGWASEALLPETVTAYLLAFSTGTFLYLGASDAIVEEFAHGGRNWLKLLFYTFGSVIIYIISAFLDRDGNGDGSSQAGSE